MRQIVFEYIKKSLESTLKLKTKQNIGGYNIKKKEKIKMVFFKKKEKIHNATIEVTDHSLIQLFERYNFDSYAYIIDKKGVVLYPDVDESSNVYYLNLQPTGFVVLRKTEPKKYVVITVTLLENRNFGSPIKLVRPRLRERQGEYEL
jgi:hypothetical protein